MRRLRHHLPTGEPLRHHRQGLAGRPVRPRLPGRVAHRRDRPQRLPHGLAHVLVDQAPARHQHRTAHRRRLAERRPLRPPAHVRGRRRHDRAEHRQRPGQHGAGGHVAERDPPHRPRHLGRRHRPDTPRPGHLRGHHARQPRRRLDPGRAPALPAAHPRGEHRERHLGRGDLPGPRVLAGAGHHARLARQQHHGLLPRPLEPVERRHADRRLVPEVPGRQGHRHRHHHRRLAASRDVLHLRRCRLAPRRLRPDGRPVPHLERLPRLPDRHHHLRLRPRPGQPDHRLLLPGHGRRLQGRPHPPERPAEELPRGGDHRQPVARRHPAGDHHLQPGRRHPRRQAVQRGVRHQGPRPQPEPDRLDLEEARAAGAVAAPTAGGEPDLADRRPLQRAPRRRHLAHRTDRHRPRQLGPARQGRHPAGREHPGRPHLHHHGLRGAAGGQPADAQLPEPHPDRRRAVRPRRVPRTRRIHHEDDQ